MTITAILVNIVIVLMYLSAVTARRVSNVYRPTDMEIHVCYENSCSGDRLYLETLELRKTIGFTIRHYP